MSTKKHNNPDARVVAVNKVSYEIDLSSTTIFRELPSAPTQRENEFCAVILPFPTAKAAKAFCKVANMTHEERVKLFRESLRTHIGFGVSDQCAERVLTALSFPQTK